jgi:hypothetical protein
VTAGTFLRLLPLVYFLAGFALDRTPDDNTYTTCMLAIGCLSFETALEIHAEPSALMLGAFFIVLITAWSKFQPSVLNDHKLAVWLLFLPRLRDLCTMVSVGGRWTADAMRDGLRVAQR